MYLPMTPFGLPTTPFIATPASQVLFLCLFIFRYLRLIVHILSFSFLYKVTPFPANPTLFPSDVTVVLPTVDSENPDFNECVESALRAGPGELLIIVVGEHMADLTRYIIKPLKDRYPETSVKVHFTDHANKRLQVTHGVRFATGKVIVLLDDHVFWPSPLFLPTILAPFENPKVGVVGTNKRVRRTETGFNMRSFWNMIGALYLERHNFELRATNAIDGGVFVVSGRTAAYRASFLKNFALLDRFNDERFFFDKFGPLNADDDNYLTRQIVSQNLDIKIQWSKDAMVETTLGTWPKFLHQCVRWNRTTWRSNTAALLTCRAVWRRQPWCVYSVYLTSYVNFALFYDAVLVYTLSRFANSAVLWTLLAWIFASKMVKAMPYFMREPQDLIMLPGYILFGYYHSLIKLYACFTFWDTKWGSRNLEAVDNQAVGSGQCDEKFLS